MQPLAIGAQLQNPEDVVFVEALGGGSCLSCARAIPVGDLSCWMGDIRFATCCGLTKLLRLNRNFLLELTTHGFSEAQTSALEVALEERLRRCLGANKHQDTRFISLCSVVLSLTADF